MKFCNTICLALIGFAAASTDQALWTNKKLVQNDVKAITDNEKLLKEQTTKETEIKKKMAALNIQEDKI